MSEFAQTVEEAFVALERERPMCPHDSFVVVDEASGISDVMWEAIARATAGDNDRLKEVADGEDTKCGHTDEDHQRESWYDEEGVEGMTCQVCEASDARCQWWTWDWREVVANKAKHYGW